MVALRMNVLVYLLIDLKVQGVFISRCVEIPVRSRRMTEWHS